jgi:hypothetical protein
MELEHLRCFLYLLLYQLDAMYVYFFIGSGKEGRRPSR